VSIFSDDDPDSTKLDGEYASGLDPDGDMRMEDDLETLDSVELDGDVDIERDGDDKEEEDEEAEDEKKEDEEEEEEEVVVVVDVDEEDDKDEDDGKEAQMIGQGAMVNTSADDVANMVDDQPIVLPEQPQEMYAYIPWPQPTAPAPLPQTPDRCPQPLTLETDPISGLYHLGFVMPLKPRPAVPALQEAEAAANTSDVKLDQQLRIESAGANSTTMSLSLMSLSQMSLPPMSLSLLSHSPRHTRIAR
jgi:hypothetical protein